MSHRRAIGGGIVSLRGSAACEPQAWSGVYGASCVESYFWSLRSRRRRWPVAARPHQQAATTTPQPQPGSFSGVKSQEAATPCGKARRSRPSWPPAITSAASLEVALMRCSATRRRKSTPNYPKLCNTGVTSSTRCWGGARRSSSSAPGARPNDPEMRANWRGDFCCATGHVVMRRFRSSRTALRDPLFKTPEIAMINAGKCSVALGETKKADEYFRRAMAQSPGNPVAAFNLALLAYHEARLDDARLWMRPVMQQAAPRSRRALSRHSASSASKAIAEPSCRIRRNCAIAFRIPPRRRRSRRGRASDWRRSPRVVGVWPVRCCARRAKRPGLRRTPSRSN